MTRTARSRSGSAREALAEPPRVERLRRLLVRRHEVDGKRFEYPNAPLAAAPPVDHHLARRAEHERREPLGLANGPVAQLLQHHDQHVLHEIRGRGLVAQVPEPIEPDPGTQAPANLRLRVRIALRRAIDYPPRER